MTIPLSTHIFFVEIILVNMVGNALLVSLNSFVCFCFCLCLSLGFNDLVAAQNLTVTLGSYTL